MRNRHTLVVTRIRDYELVLSGCVCLNLLNCCFSPNISWNIISFHALYKDGCWFSFHNKNGDILIYKNGSLIFKSSP